MEEIITNDSAQNKPNKDSFRNKIYSLITKMTGENYGVNVPQAFIKYTGSLDAAVFLAQMIHWTPRATRPDKFIFKTNAEWFRLGTAAKTLKGKGILEADKLMANGSPTWHYRLDTRAFERSFREFLESGEVRRKKQVRKSAGVDVSYDTQLEQNVETVDTAIAVRDTSGIESSLRKLIQNIPPTRAEEDALRRLCDFVENDNYSADEIAGCAGWILQTFDMVMVTPSAIEKRMPTYRAKSIAGVFDKPNYDRNKEEMRVIAAEFEEKRAKKGFGLKRRPVFL